MKAGSNADCPGGDCPLWVLSGLKGFNTGLTESLRTIRVEPCETRRSESPGLSAIWRRSRAWYIELLSRKTFTLVSSDENSRVECDALTRIPWLIHGFPTRQGDKNPKPKFRRSHTAARISLDKQRFSSELGAEGFPLASLQQRHSAIIYSVSRRTGALFLRYDPSGYSSSAPRRQRSNPAGDALITNHPSILLSVRVADCMPILLVDCENRAVAAVHAGWRGALSRIVEKAAGEMQRMFRSKPQNLVAAIGPSIRACCYEVGEEVVDAFYGRFACPEKFFRKEDPESADLGAGSRRLPLFFSQAPPGHQVSEGPRAYLDLVAVARDQLEHAGVPPAQIHAADYCTACRNDLFYSYRKEGSLAGRMVAVVGIRETPSG
jgi:purine-nucleoside/S-methyl-5'-thioadenosine phosphorylase / adenosine deaminase